MVTSLAQQAHTNADNRCIKRRSKRCTNQIKYCNAKLLPDAIATEKQTMSTP